MVNATKHEPPPPGMKLIFRPWITDPKTGKRIYPKKSKVFALFVPIDAPSK